MHSFFRVSLKWSILALLFATNMASADALYITVPGEGWALKVDTPPMTRIQGLSEGRRFKYMTSSLETGLTLSLHTETVGAASNEECQETYWTKGLNSPMKKSDIKFSKGDTALFVTHLMEAVLQGTTHKTANGHAYFVKNGLCMDLHVSHWPYQLDSEKRVEAVLKSLAVVQ